MTRGSMVSSVGAVTEVGAGVGFRRAAGNPMAMMEGNRKGNDEEVAYERGMGS